jgi:hypothetical protein
VAGGGWQVAEVFSHSAQASIVEAQVLRKSNSGMSSTQKDLARVTVSRVRAHPPVT